MTEGTDLYAVLGLASNASPHEIKEAFRTAAKAAHPDAGGSSQAMERLNEAYQTLSDPISRRDYDLSQTPPSEASIHPSSEHYHPAHQHHHHQTHSVEIYAEEIARAREIDRERTRWARLSAWELARFSAPIALGGVLISRLIGSHLPTTEVKAVIGLISFIPVYALILSIVFLLSPPLRLVYADIVRRHPTTRHERHSALVLILLFLPLAAIWIALFYLS